VIDQTHDDNAPSFKLGFGIRHNPLEHKFRSSANPTVNSRSRENFSAKAFSVRPSYGSSVIGMSNQSVLHFVSREPIFELGPEFLALVGQCVDELV
jgi:hypothetical protein